MGVLPAGVQVPQVALEVGAAVPGVRDHRLDPLDLRLQRGDLPEKKQEAAPFRSASSSMARRLNDLSLSDP